jgi:hypothetical protein
MATLWWFSGLASRFEQVHVGAVFREYPVDEIPRDRHDSLFSALS